MTKQIKLYMSKHKYRYGDICVVISFESEFNQQKIVIMNRQL